MQSGDTANSSTAVVALKNFITEVPFVHLIWIIFRAIIECLQYFSLWLTEDCKWPQSLLNTFGKAIGLLRLNLSGAAYYSAFLIIVIIITVYVLINAAMFLCDDFCAECGETMGEVIWYVIGDSVLWGVLFIPVCSILMQVFTCDTLANGDRVVSKMHGMKCGGGSHITLCVWSGIGMVCSILGVWLRASNHELEMHDPKNSMRLRQDVHNIDLHFALFRFVAIIFGILIANLSPITAGVLVFFASFLPLGYTIWFIPYVDMKYNWVRCGMYAFNMWTSFTVILTVVDPRTWAGFSVWCCFPIVVGIACYGCTHRLKTRPLTKEDIRQAMDRQSTCFQIDVDSPFYQNRELAPIIESEADKCISMRPVDFEMFYKDLKARTDWRLIYAGNQTEAMARKPLEQSELDQLIGLLRQCPDLVALRLNGWLLNGAGLEKVITNGLCNTPHLKFQWLDLNDNKINIESAKQVLDSLLEAKNEGCIGEMKEINFTSNYIDSSGRDILQENHPLGNVVVI